MIRTHGRRDDRTRGRSLLPPQSTSCCDMLSALGLTKRRSRSAVSAAEEDDAPPSPSLAAPGASCLPSAAQPMVEAGYSRRATWRRWLGAFFALMIVVLGVLVALLVRKLLIRAEEASFEKDFSEARALCLH